MSFRIASALVALVALSACLSAPTSSTTISASPALNDLQAPGAEVTDEGRGTRTFRWSGSLEGGAPVPLVGSALFNVYGGVTYAIPVDASVGTLTVRLASQGDAVAILRTDEDELACAARAGRTCAVEVPVTQSAEWPLRVTSLSPTGSQFELDVTLDASQPMYGEDPTPAGDFDVFEADRNGGEPTLAALRDGRVLVVAGSDVLRLTTAGTYEDVTPPLDAATQQTLDPFLVQDPATGRVYVSQLASCQRLSWTDDAGENWVTNPMTCGGPEFHHQKLAVGPGPVDRTVHLAMMNLASWLATDDVVISHSRSFDGGLSWTQNPAYVRDTMGPEARAVGNIATSEDGSAYIVAYLCDRFVNADYGGVGVGRTRDYGATWTWTQIAPGGGRCEGIDPGIAAVDGNVYAAWEDMSAEEPEVWYSMSTDAGVGWSEPVRVPTPGLGSFVFTDLAASKDRVAAAFLATPDTTIGPTQAPGWARWYPYVATLDLSEPGAAWQLVRLEDHPVQRGYICMDGPMCLDGARNLLDFIDVQLGADDRVYVAYPDGCDAECLLPWESRGSTLRVAVERAP